ncbi:MAG: sarcosine oxidase subunit gamma family protein [Pseudomonadota bacterium]
MSEREFDGLVALRQMPQRGMITLRGDLNSAAMKKAVGTVPGQGMCTGGVAWMSPDELLIMCPHEALEDRLADLRKALAGTHHLIQDVSDARAIFALEGDASREVLAKLCPVDLRPGAFEPGRFRRTRMAQVPCAFWMEGELRFEVVVFASVADYAWTLLKNAADTSATVGHFSPR